MSMQTFVLASVCLASAPATHGADAEWITSADYGSVRVVVHEDSAGNDRLAADEFSSYWEQATGHPAPVVHAPGDGVNVWIGTEGVPAALLDGIDFAVLVPDGIVIRTTGPRDLVIAGDGEDGALNGVYEFFERFIGVRWLSPGTTFVPRPPSAEPTGPDSRDRASPAALPVIDFTHKPVFEYRWTSHNRHDAPEFGRHHRLSVRPGFGLFVHTVYTLLPPEEYFAGHPEYYSEIDGVRVAPVGLRDRDYWADEDLRKNHGHLFGQLCFTNPDVVEEVSKNLLQRMRDNPGPRIWSVSQEDWDGYCQCASCAAMSEAEGTPGGPQLAFVNQVAERVEKEFPDHFIETLAYTWSRQVPKTVRPRHNVIIRLCSIECDFARPLEDPSSPVNARFAQDIRDWAEVADQLYIWDYTINFHHYHLPHPNLDVLQPNMRFFAANKVRGMFEQGLGAPETELGNIRPYLLARLLWNPELDVAAAREEFIDLFFREAGPHYREYLDLIHRRVLEKEWVMDTFDSGGWIDANLVNEARAILARALAAAKSDTVRDRVRYEQLSVEYAALVAAPTVEARGNTLVLEWPECMTVPEYVELAKSFGVPAHAERFRIDDMPGMVKTREIHRREVAIEKLESNQFEMWVTPELDGSVIRWHDKKRGIELLQGFREYGARAGTWQDWSNTPKMPEGPAVDIYAVVEKSAASLVIEGTREDGLVIRRIMDLDADPDDIRVVLELRNPTESPLVPTVKVHPEFYTQGNHIPEIWGRKEGAWKRMGIIEGGVPRPAAGQYLTPDGYTDMAFHVEAADLTVACSFDPATLGGLLWFYSASSNARQMNLELIPPTTPLAPGESVRIEGVYRVGSQRPG
jgi:hypothetical protein